MLFMKYLAQNKYSKYLVKKIEEHMNGQMNEREHLRS
jgi:hypothetical protein